MGYTTDFIGQVEIEDGTIVFLLAKPVPRWTVVVAKTVVARPSAVCTFRGVNSA